MSIRSIQTGINRAEQKAAHEFAIDRLTAQFNESVINVANDKEKRARMHELLRWFNPEFVPLKNDIANPEVGVLVDVVTGIYAPLIHCFSNCVLDNVQNGNLPDVILTPPRDALPLAVSIQKLSELRRIPIRLVLPHVNRNTAGISNNQKSEIAVKDPLIDLHLDQIFQQIQDSVGVVEIETGIYGTTSLVMARALCERGVIRYVPLKFYGLGPNNSYVHAVISGGETWIAENANLNGHPNREKVDNLMVLLDTMEELGMEKHYQSVERLKLNSDGIVEPVIVPVTSVELEIAKTTNTAIEVTAMQYLQARGHLARELLRKVPQLVELSNEGYPFTLRSAIPAMDSKEEHYQSIRRSQFFAYPQLNI